MRAYMIYNRVWHEGIFTNNSMYILSHTTFHKIPKVLVNALQSHV